MIKKYLLIIFVPIAVAILNGYVSSYYFFRWGYDNRNSISIALFGLSLVGCIIVIISNARNFKGKVWFMVPSLLAAINIFIIYSIYSLSNFGF